MLVFGVLGFVRGTVRETVLAATVAIAAFINSQWAGQWGGGLYGIFGGWPQQQEQFWISLVVLWSITLVVGYGLGTLLPRQPLRSQSRLAGLLLGLMTGAALAGWSLRYSITNPDGTLFDDPILQGLVSRAFIIWATWFPLLLVLLATLAVIIGPLRRLQGHVSSPSVETDWTPSATPRPVEAQPAALAATRAATSTAAPVSPAAYSPAPYGPYMSPTSTSRPTTPSSPSSPSTPLAPTQPYMTLEAPAGGAQTPVAPMSVWDRPVVTPPVAPDESVDSSQTRAFVSPDAPDAPPTSLLPVGEQVPPPSESQSPGKPAADYSTFAGASREPSWLLDQAGSQDPAGSTSPNADGASPPTSSSSPSSGAAAGVSGAEISEAGKQTCPNCAGTVPAGALFCTQCGMRL